MILKSLCCVKTNILKQNLFLTHVKIFRYVYKKKKKNHYSKMLYFNEYMKLHSYVGITNLIIN